MANTVTRIGFLVFEGAEELDWVGPWEVLVSWARLPDEDDVEVVSIGRFTRENRCAKGLSVIADCVLDDAPPLDVVLVPGGFGVDSLLKDDALLDWLRGLAASGALITSVCTGALVLAAAGLLDGHAATTWWGALDDLRAHGGVQVLADQRYVDAGPVITAQGVSAGIDMALYLIVRLASEERARQVRRYIQYDPEPPV